MFDEKLLPYLLVLPILHLMPPNQAEIGYESLSTPVSPRLVQVTRITGALSISALTLDPNSSTDGDRVHRACEIVRQATVMRKDPNYAGGDPNNPAATLTIVYTPYHPDFGALPKPNEPNCVNCPGGGPGCWPPAGIDDPRGACYDEDEIKLYSDRVEFVMEKVSSFNASGDPNEPGKPVTIGQQFLDDERWAVNGIESWDDAITAKHNLFYDEGKSLLPGKPIYQYDRGAAYYVDLQASGTYNPWYGEWYGLDEKGDDFEVSLYNVWDLDRSRAMLSLTALLASETEEGDPNNSWGTDQLVPWIGLGCGVPEIGSGEAYEPDMDYGLGAARDIAAMLRVLYPQSNPFGVTNPVRINQIALYPEPFCPDTPRFGQYFVEYVRGFTD